jgi:hypothetical protein
LPEIQDLIAQRRVKNGLPAHEKCSCKECAVWRAKNWERIEFLNWDLRPEPPEPSPAELVAELAGLSAPKSSGVTDSLLNAMTASYSIEEFKKKQVKRRPRPLETPVASSGKKVRK